MNFREWLIAEELGDQPQDPDELDLLKKPQGVSTRAWWRYGNYCGPGPRLRPKTCDALASGRPLPEPINAVDAACKQHDIEYCKCGTGWKSGLWFGKSSPCSLDADNRLIQNLNQLKGLPLGARLASSAIRTYFNMHVGMRGRRGSQAGDRPVEGLSGDGERPVGGSPMAQ